MVSSPQGTGRGSLVDKLPGGAYLDKDTSIVFPMFRFPEHWMIQDWLSNTEYGEAFDLILTTNSAGASCPGLKTKSTKQGFKWKLRGDAGIAELEEIVLDYTKNLKYNM